MGLKLQILLALMMPGKDDDLDHDLDSGSQ